MSTDRPPLDPAAAFGGGTAPGATRSRAPRTVLAAALLLCLAVLAAVYRVSVVSESGQLWEYQLFAAVEAGYGDPDHGPSETLVSLLPVAASGAAALAAAACVAVRGLRRRGVLALTVLAGANITTQALKGVLDRPDLDNGVPWAGGNSLPSGHMTLATAAVLAALLLVPAHVRPGAALLGAGLTAFTGAAAFLEAWHRPGDMTAAVAVTLAWGALALLAFGPPPTTAARPRAPGAAPPSSEGRRRADTVARTVAVLLAGLGVLGIVLGAGLLVATLGTPAVEDGAHAFAAPAGVLLSAAPSVLAWGAVVHALRPARR